MEIVWIGKPIELKHCEYTRLLMHSWALCLAFTNIKIIDQATFFTLDLNVVKVLEQPPSPKKKKVNAISCRSCFCFAQLMESFPFRNTLQLPAPAGSATLPLLPLCGLLTRIWTPSASSSLVLEILPQASLRRSNLCFIDSLPALARCRRPHRSTALTLSLCLHRLF